MTDQSPARTPARTPAPSPTSSPAPLPLPTTVIFDLGNVLIEWEPRLLFRQLIPDPARMEWFLAEVCTSEWNRLQDVGRPWNDAVAEAIARHPAEADLVRAYHARWEEMVGGAIEGTVAILRELKDAGVPLFALSNWSTEKFALTRQQFAFLDWFDGMVISGHVRLGKPDPAIYRLLCERFGIAPAEAVFIDDGAANVAAAEALGMRGVLFEGPDDLRARLVGFGLPVAAQAARVAG